jgi:CRISPR-associated protein Csm1
VPRFSGEDLSNGRYSALPDAQHYRPGDAKTFECLALDARQKTPTGWKGEDHLAVLKADVDRLGAIFARRHDSTIARHAAISRLMDLFFTGFLYGLLEEEFPSTYTVYAGGDDLLLIGPWNQTLQLASRLRESFDSWVGNNPNITLSAGVELMKSNHPLNRTVLSAENRLEQAKDAGRNRISAIETRPVSWDEYRHQLQNASHLAGWVDRQWLSTQFLYKILYFDRLRRSAEPNRSAPAGRKLVLDLQAAGWRAQWAYHLSRAFASDDHASEETRRRKAEIVPLLNALLGLDEHLKRHASRDPAPRIAVSIALYQNRNPSGESL